MKIEILYFDGCPNHRPAVERVKAIVKQEGVAAEISQVNVPDEATAQAVGFLGSPTIRIDGLDVEPLSRFSRKYGWMCRTYTDGGGIEGLPSRELVRAAIREALAKGETKHDCCKAPEVANTPNPKRSKGALLLVASSIAGAIVASFCCILPIVFALTGITAIGASAAFAAWRPYLLTGTLGLLGLGFYFAYRPTKEQCAPGAACQLPTTKRSGRAMLWLATAAVIGFAAFPHYSVAVANLLLSQSPIKAATAEATSPRLEHVSLVIEDMDCPACAKATETRLKAVPGVQKAEVSFELKKAEIDYDPASVSIDQLIKAVRDAGYRARKI